VVTSYVAVGNLAEARKVLTTSERDNEATISVNQVELRPMAADARTFLEACESGGAGTQRPSHRAAHAEGATTTSSGMTAEHGIC
jgi:hypothetical protein